MKWLAALLFLGLALLNNPATAQPQETKSAIFAGGCFWCMEPPYDKTDGVIWTTSGYSGGEQASATYEAVSAGGTGHYEVVKVEYDPAKVSYDQLLDIFWRNVDPFDASGQFCDKGSQYLSAVFYGSEEEKRLAEASRQEKQKQLGQDIVTEILPAKEFYPAEEYHQNYYEKNPLKYRFYRYSCGRDARLRALWGDAPKS